MNKPVIVIPIYKIKPTENEVLSLTQCFNILGNYPIVFVAPQSLDTNFYESLCQSNNIEFKLQKFDDKFFASTNSYSQLMLDKNFYKTFGSFEYMLLYQPDAWVFEDKLEEWCAKGYHYIGAPWFNGYGAAKANAKMYEYAGNGGFSLRNIPKFIEVLEKSEKSSGKLKSFMEVHTKQGQCSPLNIFRLPKSIKKYLADSNRLNVAFKITQDCEDNIIVNNLRKIYPDFKVAKAIDAKYFAFEVLPSRLYRECGDKLPFGCHAWEKYSPEFWAEFIKIPQAY